LSALKGTGEEAQLRSRMLRQMETTENRLEEIDARVEELTQQIAEAEERIDRTLSTLGKKRR
jgi:uncharacterized protein YceH (UPF0502 family)